MKYLNVGGYLINLAQVAYVAWSSREGDAGARTISIYFAGRAEPLRLNEKSDPAAFKMIDERWEVLFMDPPQSEVHVLSWPEDQRGRPIPLTVHDTVREE